MGWGRGSSRAVETCVVATSCLCCAQAGVWNGPVSLPHYRTAHNEATTRRLAGAVAGRHADSAYRQLSGAVMILEAHGKK